MLPNESTKKFIILFLILCIVLPSSALKIKAQSSITSRKRILRNSNWNTSFLSVSEPK